MTEESSLRSYRELRTWQVGFKLTCDVYRLTEGMPKHTWYGLRGQMRDSALSIPSNIAEGYGRRHRGEYVQHLGIARGSLYELETQILVAIDQRFLCEADLLAQTETCSRLLIRLMESLRVPSRNVVKERQAEYGKSEVESQADERHLFSEWAFTTNVDQLIWHSRSKI